jgi:hypothetical protein
MAAGTFTLQVDLLAIAGEGAHDGSILIEPLGNEDGTLPVVDPDNGKIYTTQRYDLGTDGVRALVLPHPKDMSPANYQYRGTIRYRNASGRRFTTMDPVTFSVPEDAVTILFGNLLDTAFVPPIYVPTLLEARDQAVAAAAAAEADAAAAALSQAAAEAAAADAQAAVLAAVAAQTAAETARDTTHTYRDEAEGFKDDAAASELAAAASAADAEAAAAAIVSQLIEWTDGEWGVRASSNQATWTGPGFPPFGVGAAADNDRLVLIKNGLLSQIVTMGPEAYWPGDDGAGVTLRDVMPAPSDGTVSGTGNVFGPWNQPGGVGALGMTPGGTGAVAVPAAAKLQLSDNFTFGGFFRRRALERGTLYQRGGSFYGTYGQELVRNGDMELAFAGYWSAIGLAGGLVRDTVVMHSGSASARVDIDAVETYQGLYQTFPAAVQGRYSKTFWYLNDASSPHSQISALVYYTPAAGGAQKYLRADGSWSTTASEIQLPRVYAFTQATLQFDLAELAGTGGSALTIAFKRTLGMGAAGSTYSFWIDDVSMTRALPLVVGGVEQFTNGDMESSVFQPTYIGGWGAANAARSADVTWDAAVKHSGTQSVKVHVQADNGNQGITQVKGAATPGRYVAQFWSLDDPAVAGARKTIQVSYFVGGVQKFWNGAGWQTASTEIDLLTHDSIWTRRRFVIDLAEVTSGGGGGLNFTVKRLSTSGGGSAWDFWVDDFTFEKVDTTAPVDRWAIVSTGDGGVALRAHDLVAGYVTVAESSQVITDHLGWHQFAVTKAGAVTEVYLDGEDVTTAGTNVTLGPGAGMDSTLLGGDMFGQAEVVASHLFLMDRAATADELAAVYAEANTMPDRAPERMRYGLNNYSNQDGFDGNRANYAEAMRDLGSQLQREVLVWSVIQPSAPPAEYEWADTDEVIDNLVSRGVPVCVAWDSWAPAWALPGGTTNMRTVPTDAPMEKGLSVAAAGASWQTWKGYAIDYMVACVARYKDRVRMWEVWNEYNASLFCYPAASAPMYVDFFNEARAAILAEDPTALVAPTSLARLRSENGGTDANSYTGDEWVRACDAEGIDPYDFIGCHPYATNNVSARVHNRDASSWDRVAQIHDTHVELGRETVDVQMNENGRYSGTTRVVGASVGQTLPQATINVEDTSWLAASGTVYIRTTTGNQAVAYTGKTGTTLTGCTGGTGRLIFDAPVNPGSLVLSELELAEFITDDAAVARDYFSAWSTYCGFFSARTSGGTADPYSGCSWFYDDDMVGRKPATYAFATVAEEARQLQLAGPVDADVRPQEFVAIGGEWVEVRT